MYYEFIRTVGDKMVANTNINKAAKTTPAILAILLLALTVVAVFGAYFAAAAPLIQKISSTPPGAADTIYLNTSNITVPQGTNIQFNFTVVNQIYNDSQILQEATTTSNITNVTLTIPFAFLFVNGTNLSPASNETNPATHNFQYAIFNNSIAGDIYSVRTQNLTWYNDSEGVLINSSKGGGNTSRVFSFNLTTPTVVDGGWYNFTLRTLQLINTSATTLVNTTNITVILNDTDAPRVVYNTTANTFTSGQNKTTLEAFLQIIVTDHNFNLSGSVVFNITNTTLMENVHNVPLTTALGSFVNLSNMTTVNTHKISNNWTNSSFPNGRYRFDIIVNDTNNNLNGTLADNVSMQVFILTVDNQTPTNLTFAGQTEVHSANVSHPWIYINLSAADNGLSGVKNMTYNIYNINSTGGVYKSVDIPFPVAFINVTADDGIYEYNVTVTDFANNRNYSGTRRIQITATSPKLDSGTGGGSGGGGGGGSSGLATATTQGFVLTTVTGNTPVTNAITNTQIGVTEVTFELSTNANNVRLEVSKLADRPVDVSSAPSDTTYKYLELKVSGVESTLVKSGVVKFTVDKAWVTENSADKDTIALNRWANSQWNALSTKYVSETSTAYTYEATTPGFSVFAVTAKTAAAATSGTAASDSQATTSGTASMAQSSAGSKSNQAMWVIVALIVIAVIVGLVMKNKKGKKW